MKILSFDIEDWYHLLDHEASSSPASWTKFASRVEKSTEAILEILADADQRATFFCLGWVAERHPRLIRLIHDQGHHVATHSHTHQLVYEQTRREFRTDVERSIGVLSDITGDCIDTFRAPGFSIKKGQEWAFDTLLELGITTDCSVFPAKRSHGGFSDFGVARPVRIQLEAGELLEFPINTHRFLGQDFVYSGGGYFRLLPQMYLGRRFSKDPYVMTYFHPRTSTFRNQSCQT